MPAEDVEVRQTESGRELRFAAALSNFGDGPLVLTPDEERECPSGERHASQIVYRDVNGDGEFAPDTDVESEVFPAGCMVFHPNHEHWHFDASASYVLTEPGAQTRVAATDKVSFCMRDSRRLPGARWADAPETYGQCERDKIQGITPGWADVYDSDLDGQALPLANDLADGVYCLRLTADPFGLLQETDDADNSSVVAIELSGNEATAQEDVDVCDLR